MKTVLIVDGICPRGLAIIRYLSSTGEYHILVFTKSTTCPGATAASSLPSVTLLLNRASTGYDIPTFVAAAQRCPSVLICSSPANSEGREGVQWGARLVQSAASAGAKHVVFLSIERERKQYSTDNFMHSQSTSPLAWTIIRSPTTTDRSSSSASESPGNERSLSTGQLRNLAYYVTWVFANPDRSTGLDFVLPAAEPSGVSTAASSETKRRDSRMENATASSGSAHCGDGAKTHSASHQASRKTGSTRPSTSRSTSSGGSAYMDPGRAKQIQQWVAKTSPERKEESDESEKDGEGDEDDDDDEDDDSGSETD